MTQLDLFGEPSPDWPAGLRYIDDLIGPEEQAAVIAAIEDLPFRPFQFYGGYMGHREVISFGWKYDYERRAVGAVEPIPRNLLPLREKAAAFAGREAAVFEQALVTRYRPGAAIGWHRDRSVFDEVIGVSLGAPCRLRFRRANGARWDRAQIVALPGSAYLLSGEARYVWEHSIPAVEALRYSITFRSLARP